VKLSLSAPAKTFLSGEYLALHGEPALVMTTEPRFLLKVESGESGFEGFHPDSPAGRFVTENKDLINGLKLQFFDPYQGKGGLGASSAQFLLCYVLMHWLSQLPNSAEMGEDFLESLSAQQMWAEYRRWASTGKGVPPSGVDVVAQLYGGVTLFGFGEFIQESYSWPFQEIGLLQVRTGKKLATHLHLSEISSTEFDRLKDSHRRVVEALRGRDREAFCRGINDFASALAEMGLTAEHSLELLREIRKLPGLLAAKGCGAMGADILLLVIEMDHFEDMASEVQSMGLEIVATHESLARGVEIQVGSFAPSFS
jgi:mevalonate kinase